MQKLLVAAGTLILTASAAQATPITITGSYAITQTGSATITDIFQVGTPGSFSFALNPGQSTAPTNFFREREPINSTTSQTNTITATFTFTQPTAGSGSKAAGDTFFRIPLPPPGPSGDNFSDTFTWVTNTILVNFTDGAILDIHLADPSPYLGLASGYTGLIPQVSFTLIKGPTEVPEPTSLAVLGTGLLAVFGALRLRRRRVACRPSHTS